MANRYSLLGLCVESSHPLPLLVPHPNPVGDRLRIELGSFPSEAVRTGEDDWQLFFESHYIDHQGRPWLTAFRHSTAGFYRFLFREGTHFLVDETGRRVWIRWSEPEAFDRVSINLLGIVLSFVLRLRGMVTLHASAVVIDGQAVALAGPARAGKSTTAAAFAQRGYPVLTDDVTVLKQVDDEFFIQPDRPEIRLWPESSAMLFGSEDALPRMSPDWDKRCLHLEKHGFQAEREARPLAAVYLLNGELLRGTSPAIRELTGSDSFLALQANSLVTLLLDKRMRIQEFDVLTQLSSTLPIKRFHGSELRQRPDEVCELITGDFVGRSPILSRARQVVAG